MSDMFYGFLNGLFLGMMYGMWIAVYFQNKKEKKNGDNQEVS